MARGSGSATGADGGPPLAAQSVVTPEPAERRCRMQGTARMEVAGTPLRDGPCGDHFSTLSGQSGISVREWRSILYALLEGASDPWTSAGMTSTARSTRRPAGRYHWFSSTRSPAGRWRAADRPVVPAVLETALQRMARCDCGEETSCYGCLRNFRNQSFHDQLRRGDALTFLSQLV